MRLPREDPCRLIEPPQVRRMRQWHERGDGHLADPLSPCGRTGCADILCKA